MLLLHTYSRIMSINITPIQTRPFILTAHKPCDKCEKCIFICLDGGRTLGSYFILYSGASYILLEDVKQIEWLYIFFSYLYMPLCMTHFDMKI